MRGVQKIKRNKDGFKLLATESRKLVYMIFRANQNMEKEADLPAGLGERLDQVLKWVPVQICFRYLNSAPSVLGRICAFAEKRASRSRLWVFVQARVNARQIQKYQRALKCLQKFKVSFWFQANINLQVEVHKLGMQHGNVLEFPAINDKVEPSGEFKSAQCPESSSPGPSSIPAPVASTDGSTSPWAHGMEINHAGGNVKKNHVFNVTNNRDSGNTYTNSIVSTVNNYITIAVARHKRGRSRNRQPLCVCVGQRFG